MTVVVNFVTIAIFLYNIAIYRIEIMACRYYTLFIVGFKYSKQDIFYSNIIEE